MRMSIRTMTHSYRMICLLLGTAIEQHKTALNSIEQIEQRALKATEAIKAISKCEFNLIYIL